MMGFLPTINSASSAFRFEMCFARASPLAFTVQNENDAITDNQ